MIHGVIGKPGNGKGAAFAHQIVRCLTETDAHVIAAFGTELLPWVNGHHKPQLGLQSYLIKKFKKDFDCLKRVHLLNDTQDDEFYLWRVGADGKLFQIEAERDERHKVTQFDIDAACKAQACEYFIDEVGQLYPSRSFASTPHGVMFYSAQHRHIGDTVWLATQSYKDMDVGLVRKVQDWWQCRNRSLLKVGIFRQPDDFKIYVYESVPTGAVGQTPQEVLTFKNDDGILETFDTTAGVRHRGGRARGDLKRKRKGIPWKYFMAALVILPFVLFYVLNKGLHTLTRAAVGTVTSHQVKTTVAPSLAPAYARMGNSILGGMVASGGVTNVVPRPTSSDFFDQRDVKSQGFEQIVCSGYALFPAQGTTPGFALVTLTDGRVADSRYGEVQRIERWRVFVFGTNYAMMLKAPERAVNQDSPRYNEPQNGNPNRVTPSEFANDLTVIGQSGSDVQQFTPVLKNKWTPPPFTPGISSPQNGSQNRMTIVNP